MPFCKAKTFVYEIKGSRQEGEDPGDGEMTQSLKARLTTKMSGRILGPSCLE